jgi:outer membrane protein assembly factor BamB
MLKFSSSGQYLTEFSFGWDDTPAVYSHDGTYSVITKDNYYDTGGPYYITQLNSDLAIEWQYQSVDNFEWCVNSPAVDRNGTVYADSEDGSVYVINQGGTLKGSLFLQSAVGAAYTPIAVGGDGKIYTENDGNMFVVGKSAAK